MWWPVILNTLKWATANRDGRGWLTCCCMLRCTHQPRSNRDSCLRRSHSNLFIRFKSCYLHIQTPLSLSYTHTFPTRAEKTANMHMSHEHSFNALKWKVQPKDSGERRRLLCKIHWKITVDRIKNKDILFQRYTPWNKRWMAN